VARKEKGKGRERKRKITRMRSKIYLAGLMLVEGGKQSSYTNITIQTELKEQRRRDLSSRAARRRGGGGEEPISWS
jgi:hypothetical protein